MDVSRGWQAPPASFERTGNTVGESPLTGVIDDNDVDVDEGSAIYLLDAAMGGIALDARWPDGV